MKQRYSVLPAADKTPPASPSVGLPVEADFKGLGNWYRGKISRYDAAKGVYDVTYDDGDSGEW